jgi:hypothetical protein
MPSLKSTLVVLRPDLRNTGTAGHACRFNRYTLLTLQTVTSAGRGQGKGHIFCKRKFCLKKETHVGDLNYPQDTEDLVLSHILSVQIRVLLETRYPHRGHNCSESEM